MLRKSVALLVALTLIGNHPSISYAEKNPSVSDSFFKIFPQDLNQISIPERMGKIEGRFSGNSEENHPPVILIQDAHSIPDAQLSIQKLIQFFRNQYGVSFVGVEGAASEIDPQIFKSFPDKNRLKKVFKDYHDRAELSGTAAAAIFAQSAERMAHSNKASNGSRSALSAMRYAGIEDWPLYEQGLALYLQAMEQEEKLMEEGRRKREELKREKEKVYSKALLAIDEVLSAFSENQANLTDVLHLLSNIREPEKGTELRAILDEMKLEKSDRTTSVIAVRKLAKEVEKELQAYSVERIADSKQPQKKDFLNAKRYPLNAMLQKFNTSQITPQAFALFLKETIDENNLSIQIPKSLRGLVRHQKTIQEIQGTKLFKDLENYAAAIKESLFENATQRKLDRETRELELEKKLIRLELSREEWNEIKRIAYSVQRIENKDSELNAKRSTLNAHFQFYENSEEREKAFLEKIAGARGLGLGVRKNQHPTPNTQPLILVSGGFHTSGLAEKLKASGTPYFVVMPKINSIPEHSVYREHMTGNVSWKDYLKVEDGQLDVRSAFIRATRDALIQRRSNTPIQHGSALDPSIRSASDPLLLKNWRDQIIRDLASQGRIEESGRYTKYLDEIVQGAEYGVQRDAVRSAHDAVQPKWLARVNAFIDGLKNLDQKNQVTQANVMQLFKSGMIPDAFRFEAGVIDVSAKSELRFEGGKLSAVSPFTDKPVTGKQLETISDGGDDVSVGDNPLKQLSQLAIESSQPQLNQASDSPPPTQSLLIQNPKQNVSRLRNTNESLATIGKFVKKLLANAAPTITVNVLSATRWIKSRLTEVKNDFAGLMAGILGHISFLINNYFHNNQIKQITANSIQPSAGSLLTGSPVTGLLETRIPTLRSEARIEMNRAEFLRGMAALSAYLMMQGADAAITPLATSEPLNQKDDARLTALIGNQKLSREQYQVIKDNGLNINTPYEEFIKQKMTAQQIQKLKEAFALIRKNDPMLAQNVLENTRHIVFVDTLFPAQAIWNADKTIVIGPQYFSDHEDVRDFAVLLGHEGRHLFPDQETMDAITAELSAREATLELSRKLFGDQGDAYLNLKFEIEQVKKNRFGLIAKLIAPSEEVDVSNIQNLQKISLGEIYVGLRSFVAQSEKVKGKGYPVFLNMEAHPQGNRFECQLPDQKTYQVIINDEGKIIGDTWNKKSELRFEDGKLIAHSSLLGARSHQPSTISDELLSRTPADPLTSQPTPRSEVRASAVNRRQAIQQMILGAAVLNAAAKKILAQEKLPKEKTKAVILPVHIAYVFHRGAFLPPTVENFLNEALARAPKINGKPNAVALAEENSNFFLLDLFEDLSRKEAKLPQKLKIWYEKAALMDAAEQLSSLLDLYRSEKDLQAYIDKQRIIFYNTFYSEKDHFGVLDLVKIVEHNNANEPSDERSPTRQFVNAGLNYFKEKGVSRLILERGNFEAEVYEALHGEYQSKLWKSMAEGKLQESLTYDEKMRTTQLMWGRVRDEELGKQITALSEANPNQWIFHLRGYHHQKNHDLIMGPEHQAMGVREKYFSDVQARQPWLYDSDLLKTQKEKYLRLFLAAPNVWLLSQDVRSHDDSLENAFVQIRMELEKRTDTEAEKWIQDLWKEINQLANGEEEKLPKAFFDLFLKHQWITEKTYRAYAPRSEVRMSESSSFETVIPTQSRSEVRGGEMMQDAGAQIQEGTTTRSPESWILDPGSALKSRSEVRADDRLLGIKTKTWRTAGALFMLIVWISAMVSAFAGIESTVVESSSIASISQQPFLSSVISFFRSELRKQSNLKNSSRVVISSEFQIPLSEIFIYAAIFLSVAMGGIGKIADFFNPDASRPQTSQVQFVEGDVQIVSVRSEVRKLLSGKNILVGILAAGLLASSFVGIRNQMHKQDLVQQAKYAVNWNVDLGWLENSKLRGDTEFEAELSKVSDILSAAVIGNERKKERREAAKRLSDWMFTGSSIEQFRAVTILFTKVNPQNRYFTFSYFGPGQEKSVWDFGLATLNTLVGIKIKINDPDARYFPDTTEALVKTYTSILFFGHPALGQKNGNNRSEALSWLEIVTNPESVHMTKGGLFLNASPGGTVEEAAHQGVEWLKSIGKLPVELQTEASRASIVSDSGSKSSPTSTNQEVKGVSSSAGQGLTMSELEKIKDKLQKVLETGRMNGNPQDHDYWRALLGDRFDDPSVQQQIQKIYSAGSAQSRGVLNHPSFYQGAITETEQLIKTQTPQRSEVRQEFDPAKTTILIVDDSQQDRDFNQDILLGEGFMKANVFMARSAKEALDFLKSHDVDLMLIDFNMPGGMTGADLIKAIREGASNDQSQWGAIRFMILHGEKGKIHGQQGDAETLARELNVRFLSKVDLINTLIPAIKGVMRSDGLRSEVRALPEDYFNDQQNIDNDLRKLFVLDLAIKDGDLTQQDARQTLFEKLTAPSSARITLYAITMNSSLLIEFMDQSQNESILEELLRTIVDKAMADQSMEEMDLQAMLVNAYSLVSSLEVDLNFVPVWREKLLQHINEVAEQRFGMSAKTLFEAESGWYGVRERQQKMFEGLERNSQSPKHIVIDDSLAGKSSKEILSVQKIASSDVQKISLVRSGPETKIDPMDSSYRAQQGDILMVYFKPRSEVRKSVVLKSPSDQVFVDAAREIFESLKEKQQQFKVYGNSYIGIPASTFDRRDMTLLSVRNIQQDEMQTLLLEGRIGFKNNFFFFVQLVPARSEVRVDVQGNALLGGFPLNFQELYQTAKLWADQMSPNVSLIATLFSSPDALDMSELERATNALQTVIELLKKTSSDETASPELKIVSGTIQHHFNNFLMPLQMAVQMGVKNMLIKKLAALSSEAKRMEAYIKILTNLPETYSVSNVHQLLIDLEAISAASRETRSEVREISLTLENISGGKPSALPVRFILDPPEIGSETVSVKIFEITGQDDQLNVIVKEGAEIQEQILKRGQTLTIGRSKEANIIVKNTYVSKNHLEIRFDDKGLRIKDVGSTNGTFVDVSYSERYKKIQEFKKAVDENHFVNAQNILAKLTLKEGQDISLIFAELVTLEKMVEENKLQDEIKNQRQKIFDLVDAKPVEFPTSRDDSPTVIKGSSKRSELRLNIRFVFPEDEDIDRGHALFPYVKEILEKQEFKQIFSAAGLKETEVKEVVAEYKPAEGHSKQLFKLIIIPNDDQKASSEFALRAVLPENSLDPNLNFRNEIQNDLKAQGSWLAPYHNKILWHNIDEEDRPEGKRWVLISPWINGKTIAELYEEKLSELTEVPLRYRNRDDLDRAQNKLNSDLPSREKLREWVSRDIQSQLFKLLEIIVKGRLDPGVVYDFDSADVMLDGRNLPILIDGGKDNSSKELAELIETFVGFYANHETKGDWEKIYKGTIGYLIKEYGLSPEEVFERIPQLLDAETSARVMRQLSNRYRERYLEQEKLLTTPARKGDRLWKAQLNRERNVWRYLDRKATDLESLTRPSLPNLNFEDQLKNSQSGVLFILLSIVDGVLGFFGRIIIFFLRWKTSILYRGTWIAIPSNQIKMMEPKIPGKDFPRLKALSKYELYQRMGKWLMGALSRVSEFAYFNSFSTFHFGPILLVQGGFLSLREEGRVNKIRVLEIHLSESHLTGDDIKQEFEKMIQNIYQFRSQGFEGIIGKTANPVLIYFLRNQGFQLIQREKETAGTRFFHKWELLKTAFVQSLGRFPHVDLSRPEQTFFISFQDLEARSELREDYGPGKVTADLTLKNLGILITLMTRGMSSKNLDKELLMADILGGILMPLIKPGAKIRIQNQDATIKVNSWDYSNTSENLYLKIEFSIQTEKETLGTKTIYIVPYQKSNFEQGKNYDENALFIVDKLDSENAPTFEPLWTVIETSIKSGHIGGKTVDLNSNENPWQVVGNQNAVHRVLYIPSMVDPGALTLEGMERTLNDGNVPGESRSEARSLPVKYYGNIQGTRFQFLPLSLILGASTEAAETDLPKVEIVEVAGNSNQVKIIVTEGDKRTEKFIERAKNPIYISRAEDAFIPIKSQMVSKRHLGITFNNEGLHIEDLNSTNGTFALFNPEAVKANLNYAKLKQTAKDRAVPIEDHLNGMGKIFETPDTFNEKLLNVYVERLSAVVKVLTQVQGRTENKNELELQIIYTTLQHYLNNFLSAFSLSIENIRSDTLSDFIMVMKDYMSILKDLPDSYVLENDNGQLFINLKAMRGARSEIRWQKPQEEYLYRGSRGFHVVMGEEFRSQEKIRNVNAFLQRMRDDSDKKSDLFWMKLGEVAANSFRAQAFFNPELHYAKDWALEIQGVSFFDLPMILGLPRGDREVQPDLGVGLMDYGDMHELDYRDWLQVPPQDRILLVYLEDEWVVPDAKMRDRLMLYQNFLEQSVQWMTEFDGAESSYQTILGKIEEARNQLPLYRKTQIDKQGFPSKIHGGIDQLNSLSWDQILRSDEEKAIENYLRKKSGEFYTQRTLELARRYPEAWIKHTVTARILQILLPQGFSLQGALTRDEQEVFNLAETAALSFQQAYQSDLQQASLLSRSEVRTLAPVEYRTYAWLPNRNAHPLYPILQGVSSILEPELGEIEPLILENHNEALLRGTARTSIGATIPMTWALWAGNKLILLTQSSYEEMIQRMQTTKKGNFVLKAPEINLNKKLRDSLVAARLIKPDGTILEKSDIAIAMPTPFFQDHVQAMVHGIHTSVWTMLQAIERHKANFSEKLVWDVGAGTGILSAFALLNGARAVVLTDKNKTTLQAARQLLTSMGYKELTKLRDVANVQNRGVFYIYESNLATASDLDTILKFAPPEAMVMNWGNQTDENMGDAVSDNFIFKKMLSSLQRQSIHLPSFIINGGYGRDFEVLPSEIDPGELFGEGSNYLKSLGFSISPTLEAFQNDSMFHVHGLLVADKSRSEVRAKFDPKKEAQLATALTSGSREFKLLMVAFLNALNTSKARDAASQLAKTSGPTNLLLLESFIINFDVPENDAFFNMAEMILNNAQALTQGAYRFALSDPDADKKIDTVLSLFAPKDYFQIAANLKQVIDEISGRRLEAIYKQWETDEGLHAVAQKFQQSPNLEAHLETFRKVFERRQGTSPGSLIRALGFFTWQEGVVASEADLDQLFVDAKRLHNNVYFSVMRQNDNYGYNTKQLWLALGQWLEKMSSLYEANKPLFRDRIKQQAVAFSLSSPIGPGSSPSSIDGGPRSEVRENQITDGRKQMTKSSLPEKRSEVRGAYAGQDITELNNEFAALQLRLNLNQITLPEFISTLKNTLEKFFSYTDQESGIYKYNVLNRYNGAAQVAKYLLQWSVRKYDPPLDLEYTTNVAHFPQEFRLQLPTIETTLREIQGRIIQMQGELVQEAKKLAPRENYSEMIRITLRGIDNVIKNIDENLLSPEAILTGSRSSVGGGPRVIQINRNEFEAETDLIDANDEAAFISSLKNQKKQRVLRALLEDSQISSLQHELRVQRSTGVVFVILKKQGIEQFLEFVVNGDEAEIPRNYVLVSVLLGDENQVTQIIESLITPQFSLQQHLDYLKSAPRLNNWFPLRSEVREEQNTDNRIQTTDLGWNIFRVVQGDQVMTRAKVEALVDQIVEKKAQIKQVIRDLERLRDEALRDAEKLQAVGDINLSFGAQRLSEELDLIAESLKDILKGYGVGVASSEAMGSRTAKELPQVFKRFGFETIYVEGKDRSGLIPGLRKAGLRVDPRGVRANIGLTNGQKEAGLVIPEGVNRDGIRVANTFTSVGITQTNEVNNPFMNELAQALQAATALLIAHEGSAALRKNTAALLDKYNLLPGYQNRGGIIVVNGNGFDISAPAVRAYLEWKAAQRTKMSA